VSNKPPSKYLREIKSKNPNIEIALKSHLLDNDLLTGHYDTNYDFFWKKEQERYSKHYACMYWRLGKVS
jgi:hypothetical protein